MQQGAVHSSPLPNPITRAMKRYSPVSFWPWLLAYLFLSSVAIVLASPFGPDLDQSSRALPDLNSYPPDVGENLLDLHLYPHEVGESSLETVQSTTTQGELSSEFFFFFFFVFIACATLLTNDSERLET
jgi:hypothetical protein